MYLIKGIQMYTVWQNFVRQTILFLSLSSVITNTKNITGNNKLQNLKQKNLKQFKYFVQIAWTSSVMENEV